MKAKPLPFLICLSWLLVPFFALGADSLIPQGPIELAGTHGGFDFIKIDSANRRLLACHTGNGSLDVIDVATSKLIKSIPTGNAQGVAIDPKGGRYFVSASKPPKMVIVDSSKLEVIGEVPLPSPADLVAYHPETNRVFVCNDEKPEIWIINPETKAITSTIAFPGGGMEDLGFDNKDEFLFHCLKDSSQLAKIDPKMGNIVTIWSSSPAEQPHGLAMLPDEDALVVAGNGKLGLFQLGAGKITSTADIAPRVDEIAYDPAIHRVYCASGLGTISVVAIDHDRLTTLAPLPGSHGAHSIAVDPQTHAVWIVFLKDGKPYVQSFVTK